MKHLLFLLCAAATAAASSPLSITSTTAYGQRCGNGYFFTYTDNVVAHSTSLGTLYTTQLTAHLRQRDGKSTCDYVLAQTVTLHHKERILSADRAMFNPATQRVTARGGVQILSDTITTHADAAVIDLQSRQLYLDHGTHTHAFTRTSS